MIRCAVCEKEIVFNNPPPWDEDATLLHLLTQKAKKLGITVEEAKKLTFMCGECAMAFSDPLDK